MCGIGGFSLAPESKVNAKELAHALLSQMEIRGRDASGFAYVMDDGTAGSYRNHTQGSQLPLKELPKDATTVILHTRLATQGSQWDNSNNHPVVTPSGRITLTHNGVIANDGELRPVVTNGDKLPQVDTSVIGAVIEDYGVEGLGLVAGYAAIAWFDTQTSNTLHLARPDGSPVAIARLLDGSVVYASTEQILAKALIAAGLKWVGNYPDTFTELSDGDYITITNSKIEYKEAVDWFEDYYFSSSFYSSASASQGYSSHGITATNGWGGKPEPEFGNDVNVRMNAKTGLYERAYEDDFDDVIDDLERTGYYDTEGYFHASAEPQAPSNWAGAAKNDEFYATDHEGDYIGYSSLLALITAVQFYSHLSGGAGLVEEGDAKWVNHFYDIGEVLDDGELVSWVKSPNLALSYQKSIDGGMSFITDGLYVLQNVMV